MSGGVLRSYRFLSLSRGYHSSSEAFSNASVDDAGETASTERAKTQAARRCQFFSPWALEYEEPCGQLVCVETIIERFFI